MIELVDYMFGHNYVGQTQKALGDEPLAAAIGYFDYDVLYRSFNWHNTPQGGDVWNLRNALMKHYYRVRIDNVQSFLGRNLNDDPLFTT